MGVDGSWLCVDLFENLPTEIEILVASTAAYPSLSSQCLADMNEEACGAPTEHTKPSARRVRTFIIRTTQWLVVHRWRWRALLATMTASVLRLLIVALLVLWL